MWAQGRQSLGKWAAVPVLTRPALYWAAATEPIPVSLHSFAIVKYLRFLFPNSVGPHIRLHLCYTVVSCAISPNGKHPRGKSPSLEMETFKSRLDVVLGSRL